MPASLENSAVAIGLEKFSFHPNPKERKCQRMYMPASLENSAVAIGLEKFSFHPNPKERKCQRLFKLPHNWTHLTY